jgi:hypothetical protein
MFHAFMSVGTIGFELEYWTNTSWGLHNIDRSSMTCVSAVSADGSRMNRCERRDFHHYLVPSERRNFHNVYRKGPNEVYRIDHGKHLALRESCRCSWQITGLPAEDDAQCSRTAAAFLPSGNFKGNDSVAGQPVAVYSKSDDEEPSYQMAFAPGLHCEVMERIETWKGTFGIPGAQSSYRITSFKPGEPDRSLFDIPAGYRIEQGRP